MWSHSAGLLLIFAAAALCVSPEGAELGDAHSEVKDLAQPGDELMTPWDKQGLAVIDAYANYNKKLQDDEKGLREKLANPPEKTESMKYHKIEGYKFAYLGKELTEQAQSECELVCSSYPACKSYSYNVDERKCIWSMTSVNWNTDYTLYEKKTAPGLNPQVLYARLPGLKIQDKLIPIPRNPYMKKGEDGVETRVVPEQKITVQECKYECTRRNECRTFSYSETKQECLMSEVPIHYNKHWNYYEKDVPLEAKPWEVAHAKENKEKDELKKRWIEGSSAKARAAAEKEAKIEAEKAAIRKAEKDAQTAADDAKKTADGAKGECDLATATWEGSVKQNGILMASLDEKNQEYTETQNKHRDLMTQIATAKDFESREKAELKARTVDPEVKKGEVKSVMATEKEEKDSMASANKVKIKKCGLSDMTNNEYKDKMAVLKQAEAKNKQLSAEEHTEMMGKSLKEAENDQVEKSTVERRGKSFVVVRKADLESAKEKEKEASSELLKKKAQDDVERLKEKLEKAVQQEDDDANQLRISNESEEKAVEARTKAKEKETKAENNVKAQKREAAMKVETVLVNKKIKVKQENDQKAESITKAQKAQDLAQRKHDEQTEKGKINLETLSADEIKKKREIKDDEMKYKELEKAQEMGEKAKEAQTKRLDELATTENDSKYRIRKAALTKTVLAENEADAKKKVASAAQDIMDTKSKANADEIKEKAAAVALKKATTEKDTKKLMRTELNWKSVTAKSNEGVTKAEQQKMLMEEDNVQAKSKMEANKCVETCQEGLELKQAELEKKNAAPKSEMSLLQLSDDESINVLTEAENAASNVLTEAEKAAAAAAAAAESADQGVVELPPVAPFKYKGCQC